MKAERNGRAEGQSSAAGEDSSQMSGSYGSDVGDASSTFGLPYFNLWKDRWWQMLRGLEPSDYAILLPLSMEIHTRGGPLHDPDERLARICRYKLAAFKKARDNCLSDGALVIRNGGLMMPVMEWVIENQRKKSKKASHAANVRHEKEKRKQRSGDADAMRTQYQPEDRGQRTEGEGPPAPSPGPSAQSLTSERNSGGARSPGGSRSPGYRVGQMIEVATFPYEVVWIEGDRLTIRDPETQDEHKMLIRANGELEDVREEERKGDLDDDCPF
ncbi:MAG TPA: DUF1376 domain-containing protein [Mesorhizobium sp.]|jgi:hypothetical protein|nr:DUF1376 domain-containing protein [Mesorhizobium sp.]